MTDVVHLADLQAGLRSMQCDLHTAKLGRVIAYADATGKATVQLMRRPKDRRGLPILQPPIPSVPVLWIGMGGLLGIRGILQPGDDVLLVALDRDHSPYFATTASAAAGPFDAKSERMHSLSDVVALPVTFRLVPGVQPGTIRVGDAAATQQVAMAQALHVYLSAMLAAGTPALGDGGAALRTAWTGYLASNPFDLFASQVLRTR